MPVNPGIVVIPPGYNETVYSIASSVNLNNIYAVMILGARTRFTRRGAVICNDSDVTVYLGTDTITQGKGIALSPGERYEINWSNMSHDSLYGIAASGSDKRITYFEKYIL